MEKKIDFKKYAIVYVDDEEKSLEYFKRVFEDQFRIQCEGRLSYFRGA